jgi:hypothetical protein
VYMSNVTGPAESCAAVDGAALYLAEFFRELLLGHSEESEEERAARAAACEDIKAEDPELFALALRTIAAGVDAGGMVLLLRPRSAAVIENCGFHTGRAA